MIAYLIDVILGVIYLVVCVRLFRLSRRTHEMPERLLTIVFAMWGSAYVFWGFGWSLDYEDTGGWMTAYCLIGNTLDIAAGFAAALFMRAVFRSEVSWALWLVVADGALLVVGFAGSCAAGDRWLELPLSNPFYFVFYAGATLPLAWMAIEGVGQFVQARKRERLGLCSPIVRNRYLLIGIAGASWTTYYAMATSGNVVYELIELWPKGLTAAMACSEILAIATFWLVFLPPAGYRRWASRLEDATAGIGR